MVDRSIKCFFITGIILFYSILVFAQHSDLQFTHLTTENGLSQSNITCILEDQTGFMWFGTFNGLNRFDGYDFTIFKYSFEDSQSLSHNYISALCQDEEGFIWVGTSEGLNRFDPRILRFKAFKHRNDDPASISDNQIEAILNDSRGRLWIGTRNNGLDLYNPETESFQHFTHEIHNKNSLSSNRIREIFEDSDGNLWIAHADGFIDVINWGGSDNFSVHQMKISDYPVTSIAESQDKNIWIGTQGGGLYRLGYDKEKIIESAHYVASDRDKLSISSNIILCLLIDRQNKLWIGTEDKGINIFDLQTYQIEFCRYDPFNQFSLNHDSIWEIYEDRTGNVWVGTYAHGVNLLTSRKSFFRHYKHHEGQANNLSHNMINAFAEDKNHNIWIATDGGGLNLFNRKDNTFSQISSKNSNIRTNIIVSLLEDRRGRLWVGTWTDGLYQFDQSSRIFKHYSRAKDGLASDRILHILEDQQGGLWLSTFYGGLTFFDADQGTTTVYNIENSGLSDNYVRVTYQDFDGNLWIGTDGGLDFYDTHTKNFVHYRHDEEDLTSLSKGFVHIVTQTSDSVIWIGTTSGLNKFNKNTQDFSHFNTASGLPNDEIKSIIEGSRDTLWITTNHGISMFNAGLGTFRNFDVTDGLQGNEFNIRSGFKTSWGEILFGGNNGFNLFRTGNPEVNAYRPPVILTDFKVFNQSVPIGSSDPPLQRHISATREIRLSHKDAVFSIDFVALNYISPEKNQYAYTMEGFESAWNYVGTKRTATYTNLDPGKYVFKVKAANNDGIWNEDGASIIITITPPIWKTWWAYLLEFFLILGALSFVVNYFVSRQKLRNKLEIEHLELEKMYEIDQMKTHFFTNIAHEFNSPMTLILSPLEKLIHSRSTNDKLKSSLKLIYRNVQRLQRMTDQLKDIQKLETDDLQLTLLRGDIIFFIKETVNSFYDYAINHSIRFNFSSQRESAFVWFDADKLDKIIYNLLSNAFKFTPEDGEISVNVVFRSAHEIQNGDEHKGRAREYIEISVKDTGIGIPEGKINHIFQKYYHIEEYNGKRYEGSGVGLAFVNELVKLYHGGISVSSEEGKGSTFIIQIPVDEQYLEENQLVAERIATKDTKGLSSAGIEDSYRQDGAVAIGQLGDIPVVLIVEDDKEIRYYIKDALESKYQIICAENGLEGITKATKIIPDLVVSDIKMPKVDGIQLCNQLSADERTSHIPIILLTAYSSRDLKIEGLKKGADAYLTKPFNIDELDVQIINLLESRKKLKEKFSRQILLEPTRVIIEDIDAKFLQRVLTIIEKHISDHELNAETLSKHVGMSRMQLYRKIRGLTGQTVHEFIRSIRLKRAVQLLKEKRMTITQVAYEVGFNDLAYFARCFRNQYRKSPSEFISGKN